MFAIHASLGLSLKDGRIHPVVYFGTDAGDFTDVEDEPLGEFLTRNFGYLLEEIRTADGERAAIAEMNTIIDTLTNHVNKLSQDLKEEIEVWGYE
jgi:hypothetical protein